MYKHIIAASAAIVLVPASAGAQAFDGARVEARIGYDRFELGAEASDGVDSFRIEDDRGGIAYGAEVGYDFALSSRLTMGPYANVDFSDTAYREGDADYDYALETGRNIAAGVRFATALNSNLNLFFKGGYSNGKLTETYVDRIDPAFSYDYSLERDGYHAGGGLELDFGSAYVKGELTYTAFDDADYDLGDGLTVRLYGNRLNALAGVGLRF